MTLAENVMAATNVPVDEATIISPGYPPTIGGVESHVHRLADALVHRGMPISVMAASDVRELIGHRVCDRVSVDYVPALSIRSMSVSPALLWRAGELRRGDALVHVHSYHALSGLAVCLVGNGPVVFTPHYHGTGHTGLARALHAPYRLLGRRIFDRADVVICVSEVERDLVHADFPQTVGKTKVIPNGVDLAEIEAAQLLPEQLPTVLCVGRLEAYKNVADVVAALARVDGPAQLVIIGDGPEREAIAAAAVEGGGRVRVLGPLSRDEVCAWLRTAHVVVSLSEHEAFGMTALEGAAAGAHVLLSDIPAHREISVKYLGAQATLLNTRHPDVVADHLTRLLSAPRPIRAAEVPDWGTVADDTADVYARARSAARRRATARPARVGLVDRAWIDHAFGVVAGPLTLPPVTEMRRALVDFMMEHPNHPIACTLDLATLTWVPVAPDRREHHAAQVIREMPPEPGADAMDILQSAAAITRPPYLPFHLLCFTDVVYLGATHMFCDGASGSVLVLALVLGDARILAGMEQRVDMRALLRAGRHGVRDHGSTWVGYALRLRRQHQRLGGLTGDTAASADAVSPVGQITERKSRVVGTVVDAPAYAEFDRIRQAHHADVSIAAMLSSAVYRALVAERVPVISRGMYTLVDIRRYLDRDHRFAFGNGAKSIFLDADLHDPAALHAALRTSLESVRPVPASILGAVMAARRQQHPANESTNAESGQRILTMSAMPHLPYLDKSSGVPWVEGSVPRVVGMGSSADANSIDVFSIRTGDRLEVSVTVAPGDPYADRIERAVARLTDPGFTVHRRNVRTLMKTSRTRQLLVVYTAVVLALTGVVACARADAVTTPGFFVDRQTAANRAKQQYPADAAALETIAGAPIVRWFSQPEQGPAVARAQVDSYVDRAWAAQSLPIMALYGAPDRDCGGYSAGGARSLDEYRGWIDAVSTGIAGRPVGVIIEPDGLANVTCLSPDKSAIRIAAISYAVLVLSRNPQALVYVDIGHSRWLSVPVAAQLLRSVGVDKVRGFSLNVSNFFTTAEEQAYGEQLVAALGSSSHYVIDTSRNGNGPAPASDPKNWCNPAGRALGERPTRNTTAPRADAYLWVKHPGESDGPCGRGEPTSGHWFNSYALSLIANAA